MGQDGSNYTNYLNCSTFFPFYNCPIISLTLANNTFYGIAGWLDGKARDLSVFKVNTDGTGYADLHDFTNGFPSFGSIPMIYLRGFAGGNTNVLYDVLYGMETAGDGGQNGAIFALPVATNLISNCNPPVLSSGQASGSTFSFNISGGANTSWTLYSSTDLKSWTPVAGVTLDGNGNSSYNDANVNGVGYRFYKLSNGTYCSQAYGFERTTVEPGTETWIANQMEEPVSTLNGLFNIGPNHSMPDGTVLPPGHRFRSGMVAHGVMMFTRGMGLLG